MSDPIRMVFTGIVASAALIISVVFYKFVYPKKNPNLFVLLILISILPIVSIWRPGSYESGDFNVHIYRIISFYKSLSEGNIIPSWAADLNATYGYPLFIFNYQLPYYLVSLFHFLGFSFINSMKIYLSLSYVISGAGMYIFLRKVLKNKIASFAGGLVYLFAPYHLASLHFKVALGETTIFAVLPFLFLLVYEFFQKQSFRKFLLMPLTVFLMFLSHAAMAVFSLIIVCIYTGFLIHKKKKFYLIKQYVFALLIGILMSSYIILAPLIFKNSIVTSKETPNIPPFPSFFDLLYSPWMNGFLYQGHKGEISNTIGFAGILILAAFLLFIFKKTKKEKSELLFWTLMSFIILFFVTNLSKVFWENTTLLRPIGAHRLLILFSFTISVASGVVSQKINKKVLIIFLLFASLSTILNWGHRKVISGISDQVLIQQAPLSTAKGEGHFYANSAWVKNSSTWFDRIPNKPLEIIKGNGEVKEIYRSTTKHYYQIKASSSLKLQENTLFFPGWNATINDKSINLNPDNKGRILLNVPQGNYLLKIWYQDIPLYSYSKTLSFLLAFIILICFSVNLAKKNNSD